MAYKKRGTKRRTMKRKRTMKKRVRFQGGAAEEKTFENINGLGTYLEKNKNWISRIDVYTKENYQNNKKASYHFTPSDKSKMYELPGDIKDYTFLFY
jgi:hypothetical protein